jgi:hypothetical protein
MNKRSDWADDRIDRLSQRSGDEEGWPGGRFRRAAAQERRDGRSRKGSGDRAFLAGDVLLGHDGEDEPAVLGNEMHNANDD